MIFCSLYLFLQPGSQENVDRMKDEYVAFCLDLPRVADDPLSVAAFIRVRRIIH